ncbi:MAG: ABC transporter permease [Oscillospiraceae bacterium]|nr:ABC transporter permease [Oscillospiraceae bacterium]
MLKLIIINRLRSILKNKKQFISSVLVLSIGLGVFVGMGSTLVIFNETIDSYHYDSNYADAFASVVAMPRSNVERLDRIDGVSESLGVLEHSVDARIEGFDDIVSVRLVGVDADYSRTINMYRYTGAPLESINDIWLGRVFFDTHNLSVGDTIHLLVNGRYEAFTIRGEVISPEFMFVTPDGGTFADDYLSTVGFVQTPVVERAANMYGFVNSVSIILDEGSSFTDVRLFLEDALSHFGLLSILCRSDHPNYIFVASQSSSVVVLATVIPFIFLSVACAMMYIAFKRLVEVERVEIGTLKAIGLSDRIIVTGYIFQGWIAATIGFTLSLGLGWIIGSSYYEMLMDVFTIDSLPYTLDLQTSISGLLAALFVCLLSVVMGARVAIKVKPAEAMRSAYQTASARDVKLDGFFFRLLLETDGKYAIRSMFRNKRRTLMTVFSIALTFALINFLFALNQHITEITEKRYNTIEVSDATLFLERPGYRNTILNEMFRIPGVIDAEVGLAFPVELEFDGVIRDVTIYSLDEDARLFNIIDIWGNRHHPDGGIILNYYYADSLGVSEGQIVTLYNRQASRTKQVMVSQVVEESFGIGAYMSLSEFSLLFGAYEISNMVLINVDENYFDDIQNELLEAANVVWINDNSRAVESLREAGQATEIILNILIVVSIIICFAIVYNTSIISLEEKQCEYATLRVLGYRVSEVSSINTFEYSVKLIVGSIIGTIIAFFISPPLSSLFNSETSRFWAEITMDSTMLAFVSCTLSVAISCILIRGQIKKFNLASVMKERE